MTDQLIEKYGGIEVVWDRKLDGGGRGYGQNFVPVVRSMFGKVGRVYEFCAGPGFIGFSLLAHGLCESLCLSDLNPEAVAALTETVKRNGLEDRVSVYLSDGLQDIPRSEKWDLVVSNPPHFAAEAQSDILRDDPGWEIHRRFFREVSRFLLPSSNILLQENYTGSDESTFLPMLERSGLQHCGSFMHRKSEPQFRDVYYFLWLKAWNPELIWASSPVETVPVLLSDLRQGRIPKTLGAWQKYRIEVRNDTGHATGVAMTFRNSAFTAGEMQVFVIPEIMADSLAVSNIFYLTPGEFDFVTLPDRRRLTTVRCE